MNFWWILYTIDWGLFAFVAFTTLYFLVFSIASLFQHRTEEKKAKAQERFIVLIPSYKRDKVIRQTVNSILGQTYPQRLFDIVVISDHQKELTNMHLAQLPITLLTPNFDDSSKAKSLQYAIFNLPKFKIYDAVIILNAGDIVKPEFLEEVNDAFSSAGTKAIQTHCVAANRDNSVSRLSAIFEEINNTIFRQAHQVMGLSSTLNRSGTIFDFQWFKANIMKFRIKAEESKSLQALLTREGIYIDYFEDIFIYEEKVRDLEAFNYQHKRWIYSQIHALINNIRFLPSAILNRQYDQIDMIVQCMLIPRTILLGIICIMSIILPFIYMTLAIKWWLIGALLLLAFALATPDYLVDKNWDKDFLLAPKIIFGGFLNFFRAGHTEATTRVNSISQWIRNIRKKKQ